MATKVIDLDLSAGRYGFDGLDAYAQAMILLRWKQTPLGRVTLPVEDGRIPPGRVLKAVDDTVAEPLARCALDQWVSAAMGLPAAPSAPPPSVTALVCTRNRPDDLRRCLASLAGFAGPDVELLVVDNDPPDDATATVCRDFPVRHVIERRRGLNWARSRGLAVARGAVVAVIDDDAVASPQWLDNMRRPFIDPAVAAVTGLVMPLELENEAQEEFERYGGFVRGFPKRRFTAGTWAPIAAGRAGVGACMAVRRDLANELGLFRVEMDCGTVTESGGDTYAFYRLLALGYTILYEPRALAWHRHRRDDNALRKCLYGYGVGTYSYLLRCLLQHRELAAVREGAAWLRDHHIPELLAPLLRRRRKQALNLTLAEIRGVLRAPWAYLLSRRRERDLPEFTPAPELSAAE